MQASAKNPSLALGEKIWELREERGWSQLELAKQAGMSPATINYLESGKRVPTLQSIRRLARAFGIPSSDLVVDEEQPQNGDSGARVKGDRPA